MEETELADILDVNNGVYANTFNSTRKAAIAAANISWHICPSDPDSREMLANREGQAGGGIPHNRTNYVGNSGSENFPNNGNNSGLTSLFNGALGQGNGLQFKDFTDGLSSTVLLSERPRFFGDGANRGDCYGAAPYHASGLNQPNHHTRGYVDVSFHARARINWDGNPLWNGTVNLDCVRGVASHHQDGVNVVLVDGSTRFISDNIGQDDTPGVGPLWDKLCSRNDGNAVESF